VVVGRGRTAAGKSEYQNDPTNTMTAPPASCAFQPDPNHHTLKHKLIALRAVSTTCVDTADTLYRNKKKKKKKGSVRGEQNGNGNEWII
jgi:hypothetical protein